ncbi:hypothetical protein AVEN_66716-1, partial [Araneus ventricosus]
MAFAWVPRALWWKLMYSSIVHPPNWIDNLEGYRHQGCGVESCHVKAYGESTRRFARYSVKQVE